MVPWNVYCEWAAAHEYHHVQLEILSVDFYSDERLAKVTGKVERQFRPSLNLIGKTVVCYIPCGNEELGLPPPGSTNFMSRESLEQGLLIETLLSKDSDDKLRSGGFSRALEEFTEQPVLVYEKREEEL